ncbi:hypothetical protein D3C81_174100 [compost metagenome]
MKNLIQYDEEEYLQIDFTDKSLQLIASLNGEEVANKLYAPAVSIDVERLRNAV